MGWRQTPRLRESIGVGVEPVRQLDFGDCGPPQPNNQGVSDQPLSFSSSLLFDQFDDEGRWTGALSARNVLTLPTDKATELCGPAGAIVLLHCRVVHGSVADYSSRTGVLVRGRESAHVHMES
jgi:hypothetical protein